MSERPAERLDYVGVSFGLTPELFKFWKKNGFTPVYIRQTANELTGEHSCIMLKALSDDNPDETGTNQWTVDFWLDFQRRFVNLLAYQFASFKSSLALNILSSNLPIDSTKRKELTREELELHITLYDLKRLEMYAQNLIDYHLIVDLLSPLARLYFLGRLGDTTLSAAQQAILLSFGLQHKQIEDIEQELNLPSSQILGLFNRAIRKLGSFLRSVEEKAVESSLNLPEYKRERVSLKPLPETMDAELEAEAKKVEQSERKQFKQLTQDLKGLQHYSIKGSEDDWDKALKKNKSLISIKTIQPKRTLADTDELAGNASAKKKKFNKLQKKHKKSK